MKLSANKIIPTSQSDWIKYIQLRATFWHIRIWQSAIHSSRGAMNTDVTVWFVEWRFWHDFSSCICIFDWVWFLYWLPTIFSPFAASSASPCVMAFVLVPVLQAMAKLMEKGNEKFYYVIYVRIFILNAFCALIHLSNNSQMSNIMRA